ncbi:MAG: HAD-IIA family hydrolase [Egibacteraceae bacterium]
MAERYVGVVLDLDGVCYLGDEPIAGAPGAVAALRDAGLGVVFASNNSTRTPATMAERLSQMGIPADEDEIVSSALAGAELLEPGTVCLVVGMEGLHAALEARGCDITDDPDEAEALVVGLDKELTYETLARAAVALQRGARFVATNDDRSFPVADGVWPGTGAILAALTATTGLEPETAGKPHATLFEAAARRLPDGPLLMVGDRVETDLVGAADCGWDTLLLLSGVTTADDIERDDPPSTYLLDSLADLTR